MTAPPLTRSNVNKAYGEVVTRPRRFVSDPPPFLVAERDRLDREFDRSFWAMPDGPRPCPTGRAAIFVTSRRISAAVAIASIYVAVFVASFFIAALVSGAGQ